MGDRIKFLTSNQSDWLGDLEAQVNEFLAEVHARAGTLACVSLAEVKGQPVAVLEYVEAPEVPETVDVLDPPEFPAVSE